MFEQQNICPYTGLRAFTEEESLYFKGRDQQIDQITAQLEKNKFLMLTGASGEGKSSLIYAGLIPNAKAGFFRAKYSNWVIADFRPERSPVRNMARSISGKFGIQAGTVETELRRGYSSLLDLYMNSDFYYDEQSEQWQSLSEDEKKEKKRKASNLLIIADQFEEFFTNPENFYNEIPSQDSQIVVNLMLETARLALKNNIPVYVVCTMRSDYIGQCSAFRGLPDYIGFSQFFVPRLKRKDLKQVIEEPAILSGNRISQRLVERLVYDLSEGLDQLPILQHALNQVWRAADDGREEMDLLHYAMVGGMPANELPDEDQQTFLQWYKSLSESHRSYFKESGLHRVIEIHADLLYENAWQTYNKTFPDKQISREQASRIVSSTFSCLTKIDNSRAVRNRMSLQEITEIIQTEGITARMVGNVLNVFREEGNSFIRPFSTDDPATHVLQPETVLDITHESLIRNWTRLKSWANQEFEYYSTYLDFKKQLDRWLESGKSNNFLLPIGPLAYFENWYQECRPNASWIRRYSEMTGNKASELAQAETILTDTRDFLKRSARKVAVTRAFMRYGPKRIATGFAIVLMTVLSIYYWVDAERKQNERVIETVRAESTDLLNSTEVNPEVKAIYLLTQERYEPGSLIPFLDGLEDRRRLPLATAAFTQLLMMDKKDTRPLKGEMADVITTTFDALYTDHPNPDYPYLLTELNKISTIFAYDNYYNPDEQTEALLKQFVDTGFDLVLQFYTDQSLFRPAVPIELNYAIQQWLTFGTASVERSEQILMTISPFESETGLASFNQYYPRGSYEINGRVANDFNGGYHTLASLYASTGNTNRVTDSFERIRESGQDDYFTGSLFNNYNHIMGILYQFGHGDEVQTVVRWLGNNYASNVPLTIYRNAVIRAGYMSQFSRGNIDRNIFRAYSGYFFPNLNLARRDVFDALADEYEQLIMAVPDPNERNYLMAINMKRRAMYGHKYAFDRGMDPDIGRLEGYLDRALGYFRNIDSDFLAEPVSITTPYFGEGVRSREYRRRDLFIYPDYMEGWFSGTYHSDLFFNYIDKNNLFREFYRTSGELDMIHYWVAKAFEIKPVWNVAQYDNVYPLSDEVIGRILYHVDRHPAGISFDQNLLHLILANRAFERGDTETGMLHHDRFGHDSFQSARDRYEYIETTFFMNQMKDLATNLARSGFQDEAVAMAELFDRDHEKAFAYIFLAEQVYMSNKDPVAFVYLDSAMTNAGRIDFSAFNFGPNTFIDVRNNLVLLLSRIGGRELNQISTDILREMIEGNKFTGVMARVYGVADEGNFYRSKTSIPST
ncbi:MAG: ATP-binding protein, partial [Cyclonatronaceae bacterium]